jgi:hypothetical protein
VKPASEIIWNGKRASDMTPEELRAFVEQLNWQIAAMAKAMGRRA